MNIDDRRLNGAGTVDNTEVLALVHPPKVTEVVPDDPISDPTHLQSDAPLLSVSVDQLGNPGNAGVIEYTFPAVGTAAPRTIVFRPAPERKATGEVIPKSRKLFPRLETPNGITNYSIGINAEIGRPMLCTLCNSTNVGTTHRHCRDNCVSMRAGEYLQTGLHKLWEVQWNKYNRDNQTGQEPPKEPIRLSAHCLAKMVSSLGFPLDEIHEQPTDWLPNQKIWRRVPGQNYQYESKYCFFDYYNKLPARDRMPPINHDLGPTLFSDVGNFGAIVAAPYRVSARNKIRCNDMTDAVANRDQLLQEVTDLEDRKTALENDISLKEQTKAILSSQVQRLQQQKSALTQEINQMQIGRGSRNGNTQQGANGSQTRGGNQNESTEEDRNVAVLTQDSQEGSDHV